jgi:hypothetical protein
MTEEEALWGLVALAGLLLVAGLLALGDAARAALHDEHSHYHDDDDDDCEADE